MQDPQMKQIPQSKINQSKSQKSLSEPPFIISRYSYHKLNLYQRKGHWSQKQKLKYLLFLEHFKERFQVKAKRRFNNVFDFMALFIKTRNSHQCRSHHQKMQKQKFAIDQIITSVKERYPRQIYNSMKQKYWQELKLVQIDKNQNFQQFKQRIQKQEQKRENQRQKIAQNKRILRSTTTKTSNRQPNTPKRKQHQKQSIQRQETLTQKISSQFHAEPPQSRFFKIQEVQNQNQSIQDPQPFNKPEQFSINGIQPILTFPSTPISSEILLQPYCFVSGSFPMLSDLQMKHKQHMDLAFIHYNEYLANIRNANSIQIQISKYYKSFGEGNCNV